VIFKLAGGALFLLLFGFCASAQLAGLDPVMQPAVARPSSPDELLPLLTAERPLLTFQVDDEISVKVFGIDNFLDKQRVAEDGTIAFPLIGRVKVQGLTVNQLQTILAERLKTGAMVNDPQVTVYATLRPSAVVAVSGEVNKPGVFPALGTQTITDYISAAGGIVEMVPGTPGLNSPGSTVVTLIRPSLPKPVMIDLGPDPQSARFSRIPIFAGDEIRIGKAGMIYAVGAFKFQGAFALKNTSPTTVMQLVALAGGIGYEADAGDASVVRNVDGKKKVYSVNVAHILKGNEPDVALQADDVLFVPTNRLKAAIKGGGGNLIVSITDAYLYTR
jgi:polysaccharide biosynthesis/export protein